MSDENPQQGSAIWAMLLTVIMAWAACGTYRWRVPPVVEARATIQVPAATDLGTLCQSPELLVAAARQFADPGVEEAAAAENADVAPLSGKIEARKRPSYVTRAGSSPPPKPRGTFETWELTYRTSQADQAVEELAAITTALEQHLSAGPQFAGTDHAHTRDDARTQDLKDECLELELQLEQLSAETATEADASNIRTPAESESDEQPLQLVSSEASALTSDPAATLDQITAELEQLEADWRIVRRSLQSESNLEQAIERISEGQLRETLVQFDQKWQLSRELRKLNLTEERLSNIYGDRHSKLVEVRRKFEDVLEQLGGWDAVIDEPHAISQLQSSVEKLMAAKRQEAEDLQLHVELSEEQAADEGETARQRSQLSRKLVSLQRELAAADSSSAAERRSGLSDFVATQQPELVVPPWFRRFELLLGLVTVCAMIAGYIVHRTWPGTSATDDSEPDRVPVPSFVPIGETRLDLAQRRALRQAKLSQTYGD